MIIFLDPRASLQARAHGRYSTYLCSGITIVLLLEKEIFPGWKNRSFSSVSIDLCQSLQCCLRLGTQGSGVIVLVCLAYPYP